MSALVLCPDCQRKLKVPDSAVGKTIRCPACKALIPPMLEPALDSEDAEPDAPSPRRAVTTAPLPRTAPARPRGRPPEEEETEDDLEPEAKPIRKKTSRKASYPRKKSSVGLIIGLVGGGVALLLVLGVGVGLVLHFIRGKSIPEAEWQSFSPPNCNCTVLMPGTPVPQTMNMLGVTMTHYEVKRTKENAVFGMAFFDIPPQVLRPNLLENIANSSRDGALARMSGGKTTSETSISLGNLPGREFQLKPPSRGTLIARWYLAKVGNIHRAYLVLVGGDYIQPNTGDAAHFFNSFKIDASATPPTFGNAAAAPGPQQPPFVNPPPANPGAMPPQANPNPMPPQANPQPQPPQPRPRPPRLPRRGPGMP